MKKINTTAFYDEMVTKMPWFCCTHDDEMRFDDEDCITHHDADNDEKGVDDDINAAIRLAKKHKKLIEGKS